MIEVLKNNCETTVDEQSVLVVATISVDSFDGFRNPKYREYFDNNPIKFIGKAVLKDGDEPNVLEATRIAEAKMIRQFYKYVNKKARATIKNLEVVLAIAKRDAEVTKSSISKEDSHIKEICERL